jgi:gas vesicle protein
MNPKLRGAIIGGIIGALALSICSLLINNSWVMAGSIIGAIIGAITGIIVAISQAHMYKDRETGLDG